MTDTPLSERDRSRWITRLYRQAGSAAVLALALPLLGGALLLAQAWVLADVIHRAVIEGAGLTQLVPSILVVGGLIGARAALAVLSEIISVRASEGLKARLRRDLLHTVLARGPVWTARQSSGALSTALVEQVEALDGFFARYMPAMVQAAVLPLAFAIVAFPIDWVVALLFLFTAPLIPVFMALAGWGAESAGKAQAQALSRLTGRFADRLRGMVTLKLFGREAAETDDIFNASEELRLRSMRVMRIAFLSSAVLEFFAALGVAGVALYVGLTFLDLVSLRGSELTLQAGLFCLLMAPEVYQPLRLMAAHYHDRASAKAAAGEIARQLGDLPELTTAPEAQAVPVNAPAQHRSISLHAESLTIASPDEQRVITEAALKVPAGAHYAILGMSGIGKSTLLEAFARLRPFEGTVMLDGIPLAAVPEGELRQRVAMLGQRPRIFAGTVADNIRLGCPDADNAAVRRAAERAKVTAFTDALPLGLDTLVGENGLGLSGGEVQRLALARIYLRDPALILLDEPTAHLDAQTESQVLDGLLDFAVGRTLLVATHSHAVAERMDKVFRIAGGSILAAPNPARTALVSRKGAA
ncbi:MULTISPECIES: thiol reductant ABC exporter subunit CydD [unclassified Devosia]|uniref:thiol reductant ABC exporter subunit CydD n=1 Tax=unclassified Devosia TaxID=196773 RepID=UPI001551B852|nr:MULTISPECIES: thiol reductant ABC exporter subunit CydD [unclassified Devosia]